MDRRGTNNRQLVATHVRMIPSHGVPAHPDKQALWTHHEARVGLRIDLRAATVSLPWQRRFPPKQHRVAPHTRQYTRSVCSTPFLFRCAAPDQVRCSRSGAVPARRHRQAAEALCASVLESARAQASAGVRDRSALSPIDRTARPRRHLPNAREASRQSLQPGYETPPPSGYGVMAEAPLQPGYEAPPPSRAPEAPERRRSSLHGALQPHDPGRRGQATRTRPAGYDVANIEGRIHEQGRG